MVAEVTKAKCVMKQKRFVALRSQRQVHGEQRHVQECSVPDTLRYALVASASCYVSHYHTQQDG